MIAASGIAVGGHIGVFLAGPLQPLGGPAVHDEIIFQDIGTLAVVVDDQDLVGQEQNHVPLVLGPFQLQIDRFELEGDVVAEGTVKPQLVVVAGKEIFKRTHNRKGRRLAGPLFFIEEPVGLLDGERDPILTCAEGFDHVMGFQGVCDRGDENLATLVQRADIDGPVSRFQNEGRIDQRHVPARVAPGVFIGRCKHCAQLAVQPVDPVGGAGFIVRGA